MPIVLEANYSKKVGLPGFSSHQYSLTLRTKISDLSQVEQQSGQLYRRLQDCVDRDIQHTGFLSATAEAPRTNNGHGNKTTNGNGNGTHYSNGHHAPVPAHRQGNGVPTEVPAWACSPKQQELILKIIAEHRLDKNEIEDLAGKRFGSGVRTLNKMQASGLIDELLETHGQPQRGKGNGSTRYGRPTGARS